MVCEDATKVEAAISASVEELGRLYNEQEELTFKLECANKQKDERFDTLEERVRLMENSRVPENAIRSEHVTNESKTDEARLTRLEEHLAVQQTALANLSERLQQLESWQPQVSFSTHKLVQSLIQRLKGGDILSQSDTLQLQGGLRSGSLDTPGHLTHRPSFTNLVTLESPSDTEIRLPQKRKPGRPTRASLDSVNEDEPAIKRPRGRPLKLSREMLTSDEPPIKRPRGRPPGRLLHESNLLSNDSSVEHLQVDGTRENGAEAVIRRVGDLGDTEGWDGDLPNDKIHQATSKHTAFNASYTESSELSSVPLQGTSVAAASSGGANLDINAQSGKTDEAVEIPPERRSDRTPKPAKKFGDVITWTEAMSQMQGLNQRLPLKTRN